VRLLCALALLAGCGRIGFGAAGDGGPGGGGDDAPGGDGGGGDGDGSVTGEDAPGPMPDALIATACATTTIIDDAFTSPGMTTGWTLVQATGYVLAETTGVERFTVQTTAQPSSRAALQLSQTRSLAGTCAIAELSRAGTGANVRSYLRIGAPAKNIEIYVENNQLWGRFTITGGGTTGTNGPAAYNAATMRFLRIRHTGGQSYALEYGPDLMTWNSFAVQGGMLVDPSPAFIEVGVYAAGAVAAQTTAEFERVIFLGP
jgi:hypothetical protein